jgi:GT2 family glycosyltransferase
MLSIKMLHLPDHNILEMGASTSIVILNWNGRKHLETFLPSVISNSPENVHVIVADNASDDDSIEFLNKAYPGIEIISLDRNYGYAGGYNAALQQIDSRYCILLNSDIEVSPGWIEPVIQMMESDPGIAACQPIIRSYYQRSHFEHAGAAGGFLDIFGYPFCRGRIFNEIEQDNGQYNDAAETFWATGACMFIRSSAFRQVQGFDSRFFAHMEEIDLCWRLKNMGWKIAVCPSSIVYHLGGGTLPKSNPRKTYLNFRNSLWLIAKNLPAKYYASTVLLRFFIDMTAAASFLLKGQFRDFTAVFRAYFSFLSSMRTMRSHSSDLPLGLPAHLYKRSIAWAFFARKRKKFSELPAPEFTSRQSELL